MSARQPRPVTVIGVDAGGSHTVAAVVADGGELARANGPASAVLPKTVLASARRIARAARAAIKSARQPTPAAAMVVGAAGVGREAERKALEAALTRARIARTVRVVPDGAIALCAALGRGSGILVHAGTGSIAYAQSAEGKVWRTGGLGWQMGDEGSGYALARAGLGAAGRAWDGRGPTTTLGPAMLKALELETPDDLVRWALGASRADVVTLAPVVGKVARDGDAVAMELVDRSAAELADHVSALLPHFPGSEPVTVRLGGGLLVASSPVRERFMAKLEHDLPRVRVDPSPFDPVVGATTLAAELAARR